MRILHLMHSTAVGGVESAVARLRTDLAAREHAADHSARASGDPSTPVEYRVGVLADAEDGRRALEADAIGGGMNSPLAALRLLRTMRRHRPDVLVTSLWRAVALGLLGRRRTTAWIVWVHNTRYTHALDALVHRLALPRADVVLCDSHAAAEEIVLPTLAGHATAPPVLLVRPEAAPLPVTAPA
ncbi:MAG: glycosyltransferase, partial [Brachybacterium sp.]|nr:glycosyltransferase [Brachybacterium sp.]